MKSRMMVFLWVAATLLGGPASAERDGATVTVDVVISVTPLSAPFILADENGYFSDEGLDVRIGEVIGGHRAAKALFDGEADIATASEAVVMFNSFTRADFQLFCTFVSSTNDVKLLTRADTGIGTVDDLAGRRVGTVIGTSAHFFLDEVLALDGIDPATLELVHIPPEQTGPALAEGRIDAIAAWEPWIHQARRQLGAGARLIPHDRPYIETFNALVTREYARHHPEVLQRLVRALIRAVEYLHTHPRESIHQVAERLKMDEETVEALWVDLEFDVTLKQWLIGTLESEARWAMERGAVSGTTLPNYLEYIHLPTLREIAPEKVGIY